MTELADLSGELLWVADKLLCVVNSPQVAQLQPGDRHSVYVYYVSQHLTYYTNQKTHF